MKIAFDMDGTIANLYGVNGWLSSILEHSAEPYHKAEVLGDVEHIAQLLNKCKAKGYEIEVVSWLAKGSDRAYDGKVRYAKKVWLREHMAVEWSAIHIVKYGTCKDKYRMSTEDILFDDEEQNRKMWGGKAYEPQDIVRVLTNILR